LKTGKVRL